MKIDNASANGQLESIRNKMSWSEYATRILVCLIVISLKCGIYAIPTDMSDNTGVTTATNSLPYFYSGSNHISLIRGVHNVSEPAYTRCIGSVRGILGVAGLHLGQQYEAIAECPPGTPDDLANKCRTDQIDFQSNEDKETKLIELESNLMKQLQHFDKPRFIWHQKLAIQKVSPVVHTPTGRLFANIFCARCHMPSISDAQQLRKEFAPTSKRLLCDQDGDKIRCFVYAEVEKKARRCEGDVIGPRMSFSWDSILQLPDDIFGGDEDESETGKTLTDRIFDILQWVCCVFSLTALSVAIAVFSCSSRLRRPLPGKMLIALCSTLLGAMIAFLLASGLMDLVPQIGLTARPVCVLFAVLLQTFLLASFAWMALFAVELLRTFGLARAWRICCLNMFACCDRDGSGKADSGRSGRNCNASGMMIHSRGGQNSNSTRRFPGHLAASIILPLCFALPAVAINELAFAERPPAANSTTNYTQVAANNNGTGTPQPASSILSLLDPGFCPPQHANLAWFTTRLGLLIWFLGPAALMICFNSLALLTVCVQICRLSREGSSVHKQPAPSENYSSLRRDESEKRRKNSRSLAAICGKLVVILGGSWFLQLLASWWPQLELLRRVVGLVNCAQGGVVALSMLLSTKARRAMLRGLPACCGVDATSGTSRSTDYSLRGTNEAGATNSTRLQQLRSSGDRTAQSSV